MHNDHFTVVRDIQGINLELGVIIALGDTVLDAMRRATTALASVPASAPELLIFSNDSQRPLEVICPMDLLLAPSLVVRVWPGEGTDPAAGERAPYYLEVMTATCSDDGVVWRHVNRPTTYCELGRALAASTINATLLPSPTDAPNTYSTSPVSVRMFHSALIYASPWRVFQA
ncbi:hypothetical protein [Deinococcus ruber]|uniref:Uncharacterized protein n=1 Tax=Deinococcus ruber TaxID=1848197 RepID=A0A918F7P5_9DEIO|nr:hypothetical protein [Deinococcus ruber]GGR13096.1 hypothetical protein GCM10008957_27560 [Deinococcus ruber]